MKKNNSIKSIAILLLLSNNSIGIEPAFQVTHETKLEFLQGTDLQYGENLGCQVSYKREAVAGKEWQIRDDKLYLWSNSSGHLKFDPDGQQSISISCRSSVPLTVPGSVNCPVSCTTTVTSQYVGDETPKPTDAKKNHTASGTVTVTV